MTQEGYALDILKRVNMDQCWPVSNPMTPCEKLCITDGEALGPKMQLYTEAWLVLSNT
jgi:hypothetical protein